MQKLWILCVALAAFAAQSLFASGAPTPHARQWFEQYAAAVESRLAARHAHTEDFCALVSAGEREHLHHGELVIENLAAAPIQQNGAMLHHWRGTAFVERGRAAALEGLLHDFTAYPQLYAPQVLRAQSHEVAPGHESAMLRVRQQHVLTVVMDTEYDVLFGRLDARHGYSLSRSTRVAEVANAGRPGEHELPPSEAHGYLWRLNTYWSWCEADGGLYLQAESISLSRDIPTGLGWLIGPFVQSVPRESLEFTLNATRKALRAASEVR